MAALQAGREVLEQGLRPGGSRPGCVEIPGPASRGEAEHLGGQPGGDFVIAGEPIEELLRCSERAGRCLITAITQLQGGGCQQGRWRRRAIWKRAGDGYPPEDVTNGGAAVRLEEFADGQLVHYGSCGQLPVVGRRRVSDSLLRESVPLVPAGCLPVQAAHTVRGFQPQLQAQQIGKQGMVAVAAGAERLDARRETERPSKA